MSSKPRWMDYRLTMRIHYDELRTFVDSMPLNENPRQVARQKLTRLAEGQIRELTEDVVDEATRRATNTVESEVFHLPPNEDFHPKRNQARQKLATLPFSRMRDLTSDLVYELERRYPEFKA
ncbi:component of the polarisome [Tulasnella sp. 419]|nr:component of the polarisome [Tulasnella sp. 418]KAG8956951.1 component of the polarisome [Tulasnella sp. 419]